LIDVLKTKTAQKSGLGTTKAGDINQE